MQATMITSAEVELGQKNETIDRIRAERHQLKKDLEQARHVEHTTRSLLDHTKEDLKSTKADLEQSRASEKRLRGEASKGAPSRIPGASKRAPGSAGRAKAGKSSDAGLQNEVEHLKAMLEQKAEELEALQCAKPRVSPGKHTTEITALANALSSVQRECEQAKARKDELEELFAQTEVEMNSLQEEVSAMNGKARAERGEYEATIADLQERLNDANDAQEAEEASVVFAETLANMQADHVQEVGRLQSETSHLSDQLQHMQAENERLQSELEHALGEKTNLENSFQEELGSVEQTLQSATASMAHQREEAQRKIAEHEQVSEQLREQVRELQMQLQMQPSPGSDHQVQQQLQQQGEDIRRLKQKLADSLTQADEYSAQAESQEAENEHLKSQLADLEAPRGGLVRSVLSSQLGRVRGDSQQSSQSPPQWSRAVEAAAAGRSVSDHNSPSPLQRPASHSPAPSTPEAVSYTHLTLPTKRIV
eukprot:TRINITY_DN39427_c0_g1_i1.p1 TRINITY_DN39427_c0_g1~~TRINITY_DN39427_c0_g1_i1.p1  ORF type:complete len:481 (-),score=154.51 TRINITY_DN39427_c0_g1_i1:68-1510(-)